MEKPYKQCGFTLLELLTVTAILGTLASIAIPSYQQFSQRARFAEAILAVTPYRTAIEAAAFRGNVASVNDFDWSQHGIPDIQWGGVDSHWIIPIDGRIWVIWRFDGSPLSGVSYVLEAQNHIPPIEWLESGTCFNLGYC